MIGDGLQVVLAAFMLMLGVDFHIGQLKPNTRRVRWIGIGLSAAFYLAACLLLVTV